MDLGASILARLGGYHLDIGNGGNAGQGLSPKPHRLHLEEVFAASNLAGGVPLKGQLNVVAGDPVAVINHPDAIEAGVLHNNVDPLTVGVQSVLNQFLNDRGRTLNHLPGRNLVS